MLEAITVGWWNWQILDAVTLYQKTGATWRDLRRITVIIRLFSDHLVPMVGSLPKFLTANKLIRTKSTFSRLASSLLSHCVKDFIHTEQTPEKGTSESRETNRFFLRFRECWKNGMMDLTSLLWKCSILIPKRGQLLSKCSKTSSSISINYNSSNRMNHQ